MKHFARRVRQLIESCPPSLVKMLEKATPSERKLAEKMINSYLPFRVGLEVECEGIIKSSNLVNLTAHESKFYDSELIIKYLNCISYSQDHTVIDSDRINPINEQRVHLKKGLEGLISLYKFTKLLQRYCTPTKSGIHYNIDYSEVLERYDNRRFNYRTVLFNTEKQKWLISRPYKEDIVRAVIRANQVKYLNMLKHFNYTGVYNHHGIGRTSKIHTPTTRNAIEYRIGEMSFDYGFILKRIQQFNKIHFAFINDFNYTVANWNNSRAHHKLLLSLNAKDDRKIPLEVIINKMVKSIETLKSTDMRIVNMVIFQYLTLFQDVLIQSYLNHVSTLYCDLYSFVTKALSTHIPEIKASGKGLSGYSMGELELQTSFYKVDGYMIQSMLNSFD